MPAGTFRLREFPKTGNSRRRNAPQTQVHEAGTAARNRLWSACHPPAACRRPKGRLGNTWAAFCFIGQPDRHNRLTDRKSFRMQITTWPAPLRASARAGLLHSRPSLWNLPADWNGLPHCRTGERCCDERRQQNQPRQRVRLGAIRLHVTGGQCRNACGLSRAARSPAPTE